MLQQLKLWLHNVAYKNRRSVRAGNHLQLPASSAQRMKKVRIKLGGENNRLLIGQNVTLHNCEIRLDGRDNLIEMLLNHGSVVIYRVIADADLEAAPLDALHRLIEGHLIHRELLVFLSFQWRPDTFDLDAGGCRWLPYSETLDEFFLRGQKLGVFRIDIGAPALTEIFSSLIFGLVDAERRGRIARAGMAALIEQFFLNGACNYQT